MKNLLSSALVAAAVLVSSQSAFASGGKFSCITLVTTDMMHIQGKVDGELNVESLTLTSWRGTTQLEALELTTTEQFRLVAVDPSDSEDRMKITIEAKGRGKSAAVIEVRNGEEASTHRGTCTVSFKAGI